MRRAGKWLAAVLALCVVWGFTGCYEGGPDKGGAMATAIGLGHNNCITEVTVVIDGYGNPVKVIFDDIFPVSDVYATVKDDDDAALYFTVSTTSNDKTTTKKYYKYLRIGSRYFEGKEVSGAPVYGEIGVADGITDLAEYCKTDAGVQWYYDSFMAGAMQICAEDVADTQVGDVNLADKYAFSTANGSMRKRYSKYWSVNSALYGSQLGFNGNMDALEAYLLAYGFDGIGNIVLPNKDGNDGKYNLIGGITTGATLSADTSIYLRVAKAAYDKALALQK